MNKWARALGRKNGKVTVPRKVLDELVAHNPHTTWEARHLPGVGRKTALLLCKLGLVRDDGDLVHGMAGEGEPHPDFEPSASSIKWQREYSQRRRLAQVAATHGLQVVAELERAARDLMIIDECSALVKQFFRQAPGVAADFRKLRQKYEGKAP